MYLNTADYCAKLTAELEAKIIASISHEHKEKVNFLPEKEYFAQLVTTCTQSIIKRVDNALFPQHTLMTRGNWSNLQFVGDESTYVSGTEDLLRQVFPEIKQTLASTAHHRFIMDKTVE